MVHMIIPGAAMQLFALASIMTLPGEVSHGTKREANFDESYVSSEVGEPEAAPLRVNEVIGSSNYASTPSTEGHSVEPRGIIGNIEQKIKGIFDKPTCLPQFDTLANKARRKFITDEQKIHYRYTYDGAVPKIPTMITHGLPYVNELPSKKWAKELANSFLNVIGKDAQALVTDILEHGRLLNFIELFKMAVRKTFDVRPTSVESYKEIYPPGARPAATRDYEMDSAFARWRLNGPNPMTIEPCTLEILRKMNMEALPPRMRQNISEALRERRLFAIDYTEFGKETGSGVNVEGFLLSRKQFQKYNAGPIALFEMPSLREMETRRREWLRPLAIQVNVTEPGRPAAVFTPDDGMKWKMAKNVFNSVDSVYHETVVHLGQTHRIIEPFLISMHRHLSPQHPIFTLFRAHFEGTAWSNFLADKSLLNKGGPVDLLMSPQLGPLAEYTGRKVLEKLNQDFSFPALMKRRGMDKESFPAPYPYRDDGELVWNAIRKWVEEYLRIYYGDVQLISRKRILGDYELQNWINELKSETGGKVHWLDSFDGSLEMLVKVVSSVIFVGSAEHAAVNFPMAETEGFIPAFSFALYKPAPRQNDRPTEQDYLDMLPPMEMAVSQKTLTTLIAEVQYSVLGEYGDDYFSDERVNVPFRRFKESLEQVASTIDERNLDRVAAWAGRLDMVTAQNWAYKYMKPQYIPQSVYI